MAQPSVCGLEPLPNVETPRALSRNEDAAVVPVSGNPKRKRYVRADANGAAWREKGVVATS
jgi:hypothetical protein